MERKPASLKSSEIERLQVVSERIEAMAAELQSLQVAHAQAEERAEEVEQRNTHIKADPAILDTDSREVLKTAKQNAEHAAELKCKSMPQRTHELEADLFCGGTGWAYLSPGCAYLCCVGH